MLSPHIVEKNGKKYCLLEGDLDKNTFEKQCAKCFLQKKCKVVKEFSKNVSEDWHGLNRDALFSGHKNYPKEDLSSEKAKEVLGKFRDLAKRIGLALTYGGSAYVVANYVPCSLSEAEITVNDFFKNLPDIKRYILLRHQALDKTGLSINLFGRQLDMSRFVFSKKESFKERKQDYSYAQRVSLNYPIQSTSAEVLKISMLRIDTQIQEQNWNPLYGKKIPQNITPFAYTDIHCSSLFSIHDEIDFLLLTEAFDSLIPVIYKTLQVSDIVKKLGVDFSLEMDVEFDNTRSFTATTKYPAAKIHLFNTVLPSLEKIKGLEANMVVVNFEEIDQTFLIEILNFLQDFANIKEEEKITLAIRNGNDLFTLPQRVPKEILGKLQRKGFKAFFSE